MRNLSSRTGQWLAVAVLVLGCGADRNGAVTLKGSDLGETLLPGAEAGVFVARVDAVPMASRFSGRAIVIDPIEGNWVLSVTVLQVLKGDEALGRMGVKVGERANFLIHSPARALHCSAEEAVGRTFVLNCLERAEPNGAPSRFLYATREVKP